MLQFKTFDIFMIVNLFCSLILFDDIVQTDEDLKVIFVGTSAIPSIFKIEALYSRDGP